MTEEQVISMGNFVFDVFQLAHFVHLFYEKGQDTVILVFKKDDDRFFAVSETQYMYELFGQMLLDVAKDSPGFREDILAFIREAGKLLEKRNEELRK